MMIIITDLFDRINANESSCESFQLIDGDPELASKFYLYRLCGAYTSWNTAIKASVDSHICGALNVDPTNEIYQASRHYTAVGLTVASAATGVYEFMVE
jgi:hypothetical protein